MPKIQTARDKGFYNSQENFENKLKTFALFSLTNERLRGEICVGVKTEIPRKNRKYSSKRIILEQAQIHRKLSLMFEGFFYYHKLKVCKSRKSNSKTKTVPCTPIFLEETLTKVQTSEETSRTLKYSRIDTKSRI